jgi:molybdopterin-containing oxidoreductase family iron-sulfur binding subunit
MTLESWGDYELQSGVYSIQQPTIRPLHDSRSFEESLFAWATKAKGAPARVTGAKDWYEFVRGIWRTEIFPRSSEGKGKSFDEFWATVLQQGVVSTGGARERTSAGRGFSGGVAGVLNAKDRKPTEGYELALYSTVQFGDGRFANIPWLQELPDPVTKIVWDNYLMVSIGAAKKEKLHEGDIVEITVINGQT